MTVIAARIYRDGRLLREVDLAEASPKLEKKEDFLWIGLHEPDDETLKAISAQFGLHELAVEDALDPRHLPKMESYGDHLFVVARTVHLADDRIGYGNTAIFVGRQFIITVRHGSMRGHAPVRAQLEATPMEVEAELEELRGNVENVLVQLTELTEGVGGASGEATYRLD